MVKLSTAVPVYGRITTFYFRTMQDYEDFIYVFKDHWCNVPWSKPVEAVDFPEMTRADRNCMQKYTTGKDLAEKNLDWGFSLVKTLNIDLTPEQKALAQRIANAT